VLDLESLEVVATLALPPSPQCALVRPDGAVAYVSCSESATVMAIDTSSWTVAGAIAAGPGADGLAWSDHFE